MSTLTKDKGKGVFNDDFLLTNDWAKKLYHQFAKDLPIIDYHNHLSPEQVATNYRFKDIGELWLEGDHYKWRALRANGVNEQYITGNTSSREKFQQWSQTVPNTLRNPLFHWTHLELKKPFGIQAYLNGDNAQDVFDHCNTQLKEDLTVHGLLNAFNVEVVCTTDDPIDNLQHHIEFKKSGNKIKMFPTFRCDRMMSIDQPIAFKSYLDALAAVVGHPINTLADFETALESRHTFFHEVGCRLSDVGLGQFPVALPEKKQAAGVFADFMDGIVLSREEQDQFKAYVLHQIGVLNANRSWTQQLHVGPLRNNNTRMQQEIGADGGFDSIGDGDQMQGMSMFLNGLASVNKLPKTIAYNLNPAWNDAFATMLGNFNDGLTAGKMQYGSAWWFLDQKTGMEAQIDTLSNMGLLSQFVGMLTDSRSFVSFSRHEYFRRILCNVLGQEMETGEVPEDLEWVGKMVKDICYFNALNYFGFEK